MRKSKRAFDLVWSVLGILVLAPLFIGIALLIKMEDRGSVFFLQQRVGFKGKPFFVKKFRTMVMDAEKMGGQLTVGRDPRITRVGFWLRKSKLDELPQLINVVRGEMTLVGPRPEVAKYVAMYDANFRRVLDLVPGITDPASIKYRNEGQLLYAAEDAEKKYVQEIMPDKIRINLMYAKRSTVLSDIWIIICTLLNIESFIHQGGGTTNTGA